MSIKWYKGAKRVEPRRDNPTAPKSVKPRKPPKKGLPRFPKIRRPVVTLPFVKAVNYTTFNSNLSAAGLSAIMDIAAKNNLRIGTVRWVRSSQDELDCPPVHKDSIYRVCDALAKKSWDNIEAFMASIRGNGDGIWGVSHINCKCSITVKLFDPQDANRYAVYEVYTDPMEGAGRGTTVAAGYGWAEGTLTEEQLAGHDFTQITDFNKMDSDDDAERELSKKKNDIFDKRVRPSAPEWFEGVPEGGRPLSEPAPLPPAAPEPSLAVPEPALEAEPEPAAEAAVEPAETEEERRRREEQEKGFLG